LTVGNIATNQDIVFSDGGANQMTINKDSISRNNTGTFTWNGSGLQIISNNMTTAVDAIQIQTNNFLGGSSSILINSRSTTTGKLKLKTATDIQIDLNVAPTVGQVLSAKNVSGDIEWVGNTNSYMLTGVIAGIANNNDDFTSFGGTPIPGASQGSGFQVFSESQLTHISFKYCSNVSLLDSADSYNIVVYESNAFFEDLDAEDVTNYTSQGIPITITGLNDGSLSTNYGLYPYANIDIAAALGTSITLQAGKFYAIVGERVGTGLFPAGGVDGQITLRITE
jgi:hypothetical protein